MLFYNTRYGIQMLAPAAILSATLVSQWSMKKAQLILQVQLGVVVLIQSLLTMAGGIVSLQSGQYGLDCAPLHPLVIYLAQHYAGGRMLSDTFTSGTNALGLEVGVDFKNVVYEGSGDEWTQALANPAAVVDWIEVNPTNSSDIVAKHINVNDPLFLSNFTLVAQEDSGLSLYHRNGLPPLPSNALPPGLLTEHRFCGTEGYTNMLLKGQFTNMPLQEQFTNVGTGSAQGTIPTAPVREQVQARYKPIFGASQPWLGQGRALSLRSSLSTRMLSNHEVA
jgi:hypothetical protein